MNARRNDTNEKEISVEVDQRDLDKMLVDRRNGLRLGTMRDMCKQFGVSIKCRRGKAILKARRDGLQMTVEKLHFCRIKYQTLP